MAFKKRNHEATKQLLTLRGQYRGATNEQSAINRLPV